ncbi:hypothetical protein TWF730_000072 [Orbilia blumenaviensis]|uniref:Uncharacterized protein n=1 Tax=Orbilia blumenaviensis TaxID=1796055 RepID=A0AAV9VLU0_9PEZI
MCRHAHHNNQRTLLASAILTGLQQYQQSRRTSSQPTIQNPSRSFQEPMVRGITYIPPHYNEPADPNPPAYEEVAATAKPSLIDEKQSLYRLSTEDAVPPHVRARVAVIDDDGSYNPNTGLDSSVTAAATPRFINTPPLITLSPATTTTSTVSAIPTNNESNKPKDAALTHLLSAISLYFDTQITLHGDSRPATVRKLEYKKAKKLLKAEKKYIEHMAKKEKKCHNGSNKCGERSERYTEKMEKRAEKMERWTEWVVQKAGEREERLRHVRGYGHGRGPLQRVEATA